MNKDMMHLFKYAWRVRVEGWHNKMVGDKILIQIFYHIPNILQHCVILAHAQIYISVVQYFAEKIFYPEHQPLYSFSGIKSESQNLSQLQSALLCPNQNVAKSLRYFISYFISYKKICERIIKLKQQPLTKFHYSMHQKAESKHQYAFNNLIQRICRCDTGTFLAKYDNFITPLREITKGQNTARKSIISQHLLYYVKELRTKYVKISQMSGNQHFHILEELKLLLQKFEKTSFGKKSQLQKENTLLEQERQNQSEIDSAIFRNSKKDYPQQNPKYLCCLRGVFKGKLCSQNLVHQFISVLMTDEPEISQNSSHEQKKFDKKIKKGLQEAICAALNYKKDVVVIIGLTSDLQIVGIEKQIDLENRFQKLIQEISSSLQPSIQGKKNYKIKFIPVYQKAINFEALATGKCLITISIQVQKVSNKCFSIICKSSKKRYYYFGFKQKSQLPRTGQNKTGKNPLQVKNLSGEQLYKKFKANLFEHEDTLRRKIHYDSSNCQQAHSLVETNLKIYQKSFINIRWQKKIIFQSLDCYDYHVIKLVDLPQLLNQKNALDQITDKLQLDRSNSFLGIKKLRLCINGEKDVFLFIIMNNNPKQVEKIVKNALKEKEVCNSRVTQIFRLKEYVCDFEELKKKDKKIREISLFNEIQFRRFYIKDSKQNRKLYYQIKQKSKVNQKSLILFVIIQDLGFSTRFVEKKAVPSNKYDFPLRWF